MKMLLTGATGKFGTKVVEMLLKTVPASQLSVSVRKPEKAEGFESSDFEKLLGRPVILVKEALSQIISQISQTEN